EIGRSADSIKSIEDLDEKLEKVNELIFDLDTTLAAIMEKWSKSLAPHLQPMLRIAGSLDYMTEGIRTLASKKKTGSTLHNSTRTLALTTKLRDSLRDLIYSSKGSSQGVHFEAEMEADRLVAEVDQELEDCLQEPNGDDSPLPEVQALLDRRNEIMTRHGSSVQPTNPPLFKSRVHAGIPGLRQPPMFGQNVQGIPGHRQPATPNSNFQRGET
ncbi:Hypothetical predicted protein, partial [Paramuricea clavata]